MKIAIGSASKNAKTVIEKLGLAEHVDEIADGNSVQQPQQFQIQNLKTSWS